MYSEKYIDSDNTFSANEMSDAIKKITASMNNFVDESYLSDMKAKDRTKIVNNAVLYYLQKGGYDSTLWRMLNLKEDFSSILAFKLDMLTDEYKKYHKTHVIDPKTGNDIDFTHLAASLNAHYINDESYATMPIELTSWGGDLQTVLADIANRVKATTNHEEIKKACNSFLASENPILRSSFDMGDMLADIDAVNLSNELKGNNNIYFYKVFFNYYEGGDCYNRFTQFLNNYGEENLKEKINEVLPEGIDVYVSFNIKYLLYFNHLRSRKYLYTANNDISSILNETFYNYIYNNALSE